MQLSVTLLALAATLHSAFAEVVCNSDAVHYRPKILTSAERAGFADSIDKICTPGSQVIEDQSGSFIFSLNHVQDTLSKDECQAKFESIVDQCVANWNNGGGTFITAEVTLKVHTDTSNNEKILPRARAQQKKPKPAPAPAPAKPTSTASTKPASTKPASTKPASTKLAQSSPTPSKSAQASTTTKTSSTQQPPAPSAPCQPAKKTGKNGAKNKNTQPGKKTARQVLESIVYGIFRRATLGQGGPSDTQPAAPACATDSRIMKTLPGFGSTTYFGFQATTQQLTVAQVEAVAKRGYADLNPRFPTNRALLVSALYIPGKGVYLGTMPDYVGQTVLLQKARSDAPEYAEMIEGRQMSSSNAKKVAGTPDLLYHAEDAAIYYAYKMGGVDQFDYKFPEGSRIKTWGRSYKNGPAEAAPACSDINGNKSKIQKPTCQSVITELNIKERDN
ncbi:hypothetical protein DM02DRAFT_621454 [Periconia macrospinosa]|uniref:Uncharacterized protein n=1 Tax=Periconia macrospinosa TaxID=97972 RepID=A0A2V1EDJ9_9PLEO|nr:hypothetical protein DM02DRAFT_621454 [Periconia macrospinosa]